jgi:hypothetical protein
LITNNVGNFNENIFRGKYAIFCEELFTRNDGSVEIDTFDVFRQNLFGKFLENLINISSFELIDTSRKTTKHSKENIKTAPRNQEKATRKDKPALIASYFIQIN